MLQFQYSSSGTTTVAQWIDEAYSNNAVFYQFTSSFSGKRTQIDADVVSNTSQDTLGGWITLRNQNSDIPQASGQYTLNIYKTISGSGNPEWIYASDAWANETETWGTYSGVARGLGDLLTTNRAFVSGSDFDVITKYQYEDEPIYSVYDG